MSETKHYTNVLKQWNKSVEWSWEHLPLAVALEANDLHRETNQLLRELINRMDSLGGDGLHVVIKEHARRAREAKRVRAARKLASK